MTTELVELAERPEFTVDEALRIADQNADSYEKVASVSRTLAAEVRRLRALASRAGGWLPIDSAPRDGTQVFVYAPGETLFPTAAEYKSSAYFAKEYGDAGYMDEGWYWSYGYPNDMHEETITPTHWQPLPEPPAAPEPVAVGS